MNRAVIAGVTALALGIGAVAFEFGFGANAIGTAADWEGHSGDSDETNYSRLDQIGTANVTKLGLAWSLDLPGEASLEATPLAINGTLYFTGSYGAIYATDGATGKLLWRHDPEIWNHNSWRMRLIYSVNRGVAYADGRIFSATLDGRLLALDARSGKLLWSVDTLPPGALAFITGAPRTFKDKVIIGNGGSDYGTRGYVTAYDQASGKQVWRFHSTPGTAAQNRGDPAMEMAAKSWTGPYWKTGTGGAVWDGITFDAKYNRIYIGIGNGGPGDPSIRSPGGGDNLFTSSVVALDADTGHYVWHYQANPRDAWDFDSTQQMTLARLVIAGKTRDVLMQAPKNGFFYVLDRTNGRLISAEKLGKVTWADRIDLATGRPVETKGSRYESGDVVVWPTSVGAHSWHAMSFSPKAGLVFIPYMQSGNRIYRGETKPGDITAFGLSLGTVKTDAQDGKGALLAWDPVTQKQRWRVSNDALLNGGLLSTAGNLVFQGTGDGYVNGYNAATGARLWHFSAGLGIIAAPMTYEAGGKQFIAVLVGYGASAAAGGDDMNTGGKWTTPRRLLSFAIGGAAKLPPASRPTVAVTAVDNPGLVLKASDVAAGGLVYQRCYMCHGRAVVGVGAPGPDLRESQIALDSQAFRSVVHDGALIERGMPRFDMLDDRQIDQVYAYIRSRARAALPAATPSGAAKVP